MPAQQEPGTVNSRPDVSPPEPPTAPLSSHLIPRPRARHWLPVFIILLVVAAVILPPLVNINRYQRQITESLSNAIGRPVHMTGVKLVMLPRPGFEISDFVVDENPAFGFEPILRSATVRASVRLTSLWRGRLEIARIRFEDPSLNLVRNEHGRWNFASVLVQAARIPNAPTAQKHAGHTLRFPYIEASNARLNFKYGNEKRPFSFVNADLSMWLAQPDEWQVRFEAQPVRTDLDLNLADTGVVRIEGGLHRAPTLQQMPLNLAVNWSGASLGQLSRLLSGDDPGWRGTIDLRGTVTGTPEATQLRARLRGAGIHRIEFEPDNTLELNATCEMQYHHALQSLESLACLSPVGSGQLLLTGAIHDLGSSPVSALTLQLEKVPVAAIFRTLQIMRRNFPSSIGASGNLDGQFTFDGSRPAPLAGQASIPRLVLASDSLRQPLVFSDVTLSATSSTPAAAVPAPHTRRPASTNRVHSATLPADADTGQPSLRLSALSLAAAGDPALALNARFSASEYSLQLTGAAPLSRLIALSRTFNFAPVPTNGLAPQGSADLDLTVHGPWLPPLSAQNSLIASAPGASPAGPGTNAAAIEGSLHLRNAELRTTFLTVPIEIVSAQGTFSGDKVAWDPISINYGPAHADGSLLAPIPCPVDGECTRHFDLHLATLDVAALQSTLLGARRGQLLEEILTRIAERPRPWPRLEGALHIDTLSLNDQAASPLVLHHAEASLAAAGNLLTIRSLAAQAFGGDLKASGQIDATGDLPAYTLQLNLSGGEIAQAAVIFQEKWGPGSFNLSSRLQFSGFTSAQLTDSATGSFSGEWTRHNPAAASDPGSAAAFSHFDSWTGTGTIANRRLNFNQSSATFARNLRPKSRNVAIQPAPVPITGSVSFARELSLRMGAGSDAVDVDGTLEEPAPVAPAKPAAAPRAAPISRP